MSRMTVQRLAAEVVVLSKNQKRSGTMVFSRGL